MCDVKDKKKNAGIAFYVRLSQLATVAIFADINLYAAIKIFISKGTLLMHRWES